MKKINSQAAHEVLTGPPGMLFFASVVIPVLLILVRLA